MTTWNDCKRVIAFWPVWILALFGCAADLSGPESATQGDSARLGVDYSYARPSPAGIRGAGYTFAVRYLSHDPSKNISAGEAKALIGAGVDVVSNWESTADSTLGGYNAGVSDAQAATAQAAAAGSPEGRPIYFSIDFDATPGQQATIDAYMDGAASVIGRGRVGAYGGYWVVKRLFDDGKIAFGWQTYAWSGGNWDPRAQLRQVHNDVSVAGGDCDIDQAMALDFGQWGVGPTAPPALEGAQSVLTPGQQHFFFGDSSGTLHHAFWDATAQAVLHDTWASGLAGVPVAMIDGSQQNVFARGPTGTLDHWWWDPQSNRINHDTWGSGIASDPTCALAGGQQHTWAVDGAGNLQHWFWDPKPNAILHDTWGSGAVGRPSFMPAGAEQHVFARGTAGTLEHWWWEPTTNQINHDSWGTGVAADPAAALIDDDQHVWAVDGAGNLQHWFWDPSSNQIFNNTWGSGAAGRPSLLQSGGQQHVFARGTGGTLEHWWWEPSTGDINHDTWGSGIAADPTAIAIGGQQHVWALDGSGEIQHWYWDGNQLIHDDWGR
jgi:hypothetical protein